MSGRTDAARFAVDGAMAVAFAPSTEESEMRAALRSLSGGCSRRSAIAVRAGALAFGRGLARRVSPPLPSQWVSIAPTCTPSVRSRLLSLGRGDVREHASAEG